MTHHVTHHVTHHPADMRQLRARVQSTGRTARRLSRYLLLIALALAAIGMAVDGQRWLLHQKSAQSIEYVAATCAVDAFYGEPQSALAAACANAPITTGKSL